MALKRDNYLEWQEYFMSIAFLSAQRSKDPRTQVGACIVNKENKIVGIGYNGMPIGCDDEQMPWNPANDDSKESWFNSKSPYVCHAELNAVLNKNQGEVKDCIIYVALFPCNVCAQIIVQSGIKEVVYYSDKYHHRFEFKASRRILDTAQVKYRQFQPRQKQITIQFDMIEQSGGQEPIIMKTLDESCDSSTTLPLKDIDSNTTRLSESIWENKNSNAHDEMLNNNNIVKRKTAILFDHALQQNLPQNIREELLQSNAETIRSNFNSMSRSPVVLELNFAIYSLGFIVSIMAFTWLLANTGLLNIKT